MKKPQHIKICLNAMVGSEEATITRMLQSVADYIDYYVIQCNGSDNTKQIIDDFFKEKGISGFTYEIDWQYPGFNRNHTLQAALEAQHGCDWILRMDADEQLAVDDNFDWSPFEDTSIQSFNIVADPGDSLYFRTWLWNAKLPWFFALDKRHETIHLPEVGEDFQRVPLDKGFRHIITNDGETWFAPMKFLKDALELESEKVPSNKVLEDDYHLWYIAKSYSDSYGNPDQFPFGMDHAMEYARRAIFYFKMYFNKVHNYSETGVPARLDDMGYFGMVLSATAFKFLGQIDMAIETYQRAEAFSPNRSEHLEKLALIYEEEGMYDLMLQASAQMLIKKNPFPESSFLVNNSAYPDTSPIPLWIHIRAIKHLGDDPTDEIKALHLNYPDVPSYILKDVYSTKYTVVEDIAFVRREENENPEITMNLFGGGLLGAVSGASK